MNIETRADYLKLVGISIAVNLRQKDPKLGTDFIESAVVENLSDSGTRLVLKDAVVKRWWFLKRRYRKCSVGVDHITFIEVLDRGVGLV